MVVGQPLTDTLSTAEVDAIIGQKLGHVANNDMRRMGFACSFQNALVWYLEFSDTAQRWAYERKTNKVAVGLNTPSGS